MNVYSLIPLISAVIYIILFFVVVFNRTLQKQHRLFLLYLAAAITWAVFNSFLLSHYFMEHKLLLFRIVICASMWWAVQLYSFARVFLDYRGGIGVKIGYASLLCMIVLAFTGFAPADIIIEDNIFAGPVYDWWFIIYITPLLLLTATGVYALIRRLRIRGNPEERNKISYLILAVIMIAIFGFIGVTPVAQGGKFPVTHIGGILSAFILAYAIIRHELVSINSVLRQILGWILLFVVGICCFALLFFLFSVVFDFSLSYQTLVFGTVTASLTALFVYFLRPTFSTMVDYFFYRERYSYRQMLLRFDTEMGNIISLDELANRMLSVIVKALNTPGAILLFQNETDGDYIARYRYPESNSNLEDIPKFVHDNPVITWLEKENNVLNLNQVDLMKEFGGLWHEEKQVLKTSGLGLLCSIKSRGKLVGILALENKKSKKVFSQEDIEMIKGMAGKAGIIVENAAMFDALKQQQYQVQRLLSDAINARESERQRISVDLHDSVAQWLAGASYQAQTVEALLSAFKNEKIQEQITLVENTIEKSLKELRRVVVDLRPPALDELGLNHALRQSLGTLSNEGIFCSFSEEGTPVRLSPEVEITVYRVAQEAFTNIRKHAGASKVEIKIEYKETSILVKIQDNGKGFNLSNTLHNAISVGNLGLLGMRQRVEMLGGIMKIRTRPGGGTLISMNLPVNREIKGNTDEKDRNISD